MPMIPVKKKRILLASVLKPIDDTRMFEKMGRSLAEVANYEVFIVGYPSKEAVQETDSLHFLPPKKFSRISFGRLLAPLKVFKITHQVKPDVLIVNSHELLIVALANRILFGTKIIYDIQENYWRNILQTNAFPKAIRPILATWVRLKEKLTSPFFDWIFMAEKGYEKEFGFVSKKYSVVENKVRVPMGFERKKEPTKIKLLFSGTLAEGTGIFEAIELAKGLHQIEPTIELLVIGYCSLPRTLNKIKTAIQNYSFITLVGGDSLVPHFQIMEALAEVNFGIVSYRISPHIENSIPTKLYEYLGCQLPILLNNHQPWIEMCAPYHAAIVVDFDRPDFKAILKSLSQNYYLVKPKGMDWKSEEVKFLSAISQLLD